jgi:hypothetical protein
MNKNKLQKFLRIYQEVKKVYSDCTLDFDVACKIRQLDYCSNNPVCIDTAIDILNECMTGYNNFTPNILENLKEIDENGEVYIAREGSVAIYFVSKLSREEKSVLEDIESNNYSEFEPHKFYGSTLKPSTKSQKTIKSSFQTSSYISKKMLVDECNLVLINSVGRIYNSCEGNNYIVVVNNNIFPKNIPLNPNTKVFRFWWD